VTSGRPALLQNTSHPQFPRVRTQLGYDGPMILFVDTISLTWSAVGYPNRPSGARPRPHVRRPTSPVASTARRVCRRWLDDCKGLESAATMAWSSVACGARTRGTSGRHLGNRDDYRRDSYRRAWVVPVGRGWQADPAMDCSATSCSPDGGVDGTLRTGAGHHQPADADQTTAGSRVRSALGVDVSPFARVGNVKAEAAPATRTSAG